MLEEEEISLEDFLGLEEDNEPVDMTDSVSILRELVRRIQRLEDHKEAIAGDIKLVYDEAEDFGFEKKILREVIKYLKKPAEERELQEHTLATYLHALGVL